MYGRLSRKPTIDSSKYVIGHYKLLGEKVHHSKKKNQIFDDDYQIDD